MKNLFIIIILGSLPFAETFTQTAPSEYQSAIEGFVFDQSNKEPLAGVHVLIKSIKQGTFTDEKGYFILPKLPPGKYTLRFSYIGYTPIIKEHITVDTKDILSLAPIRMKSDAFSLSAITVTPGNFSIMGDPGLSKQTLSETQIKNMSWAEDVTRAVARLPGISSSDYSSKFSIRGGDADEVLITLDGMELYEPFHQRDYSGGLFSIVDIETIHGIDLMTGGFSSIYGNRLSGVLNLKTKLLHNQEQESSVGLSIMNARLYKSGKFAKNKGAYLFSARRGMLDLLFKSVGATENLPVFYDGMAKVSYTLNDKHMLSMHLLHAGDKTKVRDISEDGNYDKNDTQYTNNYAWLTLKSYPTHTLSFRTIAYAGDISHERNGEFNKYEFSDKGTFQLRDKRAYNFIGGKHDASWQVSEQFALAGGLEIKQVNADYDYDMELSEIRINKNEELTNYVKVNNTSLRPSGWQSAVYLNTKWRPASRLILEAGLRNDQSTYAGDDVWSPRLSAVYSVSEQTFIRAAWGKYYQSQFINDLDVNNGFTNFNQAELARHYVIGFEHQFEHNIELRVETYLKDLSNISPKWQNLRDHLEMFPEQRNDNARIIYNGGESKGIEIFLKQDNGGKFSWWLSYSLAKAEDNIQDIEFDGILTEVTGKVPRLNNQRHTVYFDLNYRPNNKWHYNLSWQYYKGWPRTNYTYDYQVLSNGDLHFYQIHQGFNQTLYPAYHRMDLRINRQFNMRKGTLTAFLHLVNLYNHENLKKFDLDVSDDNDNPSLDAEGNYVPVRDDTYWLGFLPVFGASWSF